MVCPPGCPLELGSSPPRRHFSGAVPLVLWASLVLGALYDLTLAWAHRTDFPIVERSARMARLLADALSPSDAEKRRVKRTTA